jgi:hypothetical protein
MRRASRRRCARPSALAGADALKKRDGRRRRRRKRQAGGLEVVEILVFMVKVNLLVKFEKRMLTCKLNSGSSWLLTPFVAFGHPKTKSSDESAAGQSSIAQQL